MAWRPLVLSLFMDKAADVSIADARAAFRAGLKDMVPAFPAIVAWGLVTGVAMAQSGLPLTKAYGLSTISYAGSAQLAALPLLVGHAPVWVIALTALMVNLRFVIYSAALRPVLAELSLRRRFGLAYLIGDMSFVMYMRHSSSKSPATRAAYFGGLSAANFLPWHFGSYVGLFAAGHIPADWGLDFAGLLALLALLVPLLASLPTVVGCVIAGIAGIALNGLPAHAGLIVATLLGIAGAVAVDHLRPS